MMFLSKNKINNLLFFTFVLFTTLSSLLGDNLLFRFRYIVGIILFIFLIIDKKISLKISKETLLFLFVFIFLGAIPASFYNSNIDWKYVFVQLIYMVVSYTMLEFDISEKWIESLLWIIHIVFFVTIFMGNVFIKLFVNISTNYMSVIYIIIIFVYAILCDKNKKEIKKHHIYLAFIMSIFAGGRGGVICTAIVVAGMVLNEKSRIKGVLFIILGIMLFLILSANSNYVSLIFYNFAEKGLDSNGRMIFWKNYLDECNDNITNILWGCNIRMSLSRYYYNIQHLHNSYLTLYGNMGLIASFYILFNVFGEAIQILRNSKKIIFVILLAFFIRAFTDIVFAGYMGEIVIYYLIWLGIKRKNNSRRMLVYAKNY